MTTTSAGPHGFHVKPPVVVLAATAIMTAALLVALQVGRDGPESVPNPIEATAEATAPLAKPNGLVQAFVEGKFDAGLIPAPSPATAGAVPVPELVLIAGQGDLYEALIAGKFVLDFGAGDPGVQYVLSPETSASQSGLWDAFADGKFDAGLGESEQPSQPSAPAAHKPTISGGNQP